MTATEIVTLTNSTILKGLKVSSDATTVLSLLNLAKNQIAQDCLLWMGGEQLTMVADTYEYDFASGLVPIQIIDVYDDGLSLRPRNSPSSDGYFQVAPETIRVNTPVADEIWNVNYYYTPDDYIGTDEVKVPASLISAMQYFIAHKAFEMYRSENEFISSREYLDRYNQTIAKFLSQTDNSNTDTILSVDLIRQKNLV